MARSRRRFSQRAVRRKFVWARSSASLIVSSDEGIRIDLLSDFATEYGANLIGATVMRIRGQAFAKGETGTGRLVAGIRVYDRQGSLAEEEGPIESPHSDWMSYRASLLDGAAGTSTIYNDERYELDVKSARKIEELGQSLLLAVQHDVVTTALTYVYDFSIGLKLP